MKLARVSLYAVAVGFLGLGLQFMLLPGALTTQIGIVLPTPVAVMEIRGVYGGFFFGTGLFFLLFARRDVWLRPGLVAQASIMGALVVGRTVGLILDGRPNALIAALLAVEFVATIVALVGLKQLDGAASAA